jgi:DNA-directed RNA polymerase
LQDWTDWNVGGYCDRSTRISTSFVRGALPVTKKAIRRAFRDGSMKQHVDGVNRLQRVWWTINSAILPLVQKFAGWGNQDTALRTLIDQDIASAKYLGDRRFQLPMYCDFRGRCYSLTHFNFMREDHVRALFQFADGLPIGQDGHNWLMLHVATRGDFDGIGKRSWPERIDWVEQNYDRIKRTAQNPDATVDWWRNADDPFSFVAGCIELVAARETGPNYISRLPVCFDGSCSGIQHLAMMTRDEVAGRLVNLIPNDLEPQDVYQLITGKVEQSVGAQLDDWTRPTKQIKGEEVLLKPRAEYARFWVDKLTRKLIKRPAMTFAYSVTTQGMADQLAEVYGEIHRVPNADGTYGYPAPSDAAAKYLAGHIMDAAKEILPRPAAAMKFIRKLAGQCADKGKALEWTSPTGFPVVNQYYEPDVRIVTLELQGVRVRHKVADDSPHLSKRDSKNSAAPNFVHSLDASHLIRVINAAAGEGITNIAVVHDSFGCLAPQAFELHQIIREQMARLYAEHDVLAELRRAAGSSEPLPAKGTLDPWAVRHSTYAFA